MMAGDGRVGGAGQRMCPRFCPSGTEVNRYMTGGKGSRVCVSGVRGV